MSVGDIPVPLSSQNPNYLISIFGTDEQGKPIGVGDGNSSTPLLGILSPMPEEFNLEVSSSWHPLLDGVLKGLANRFLGESRANLVNNGLAMFGYSLSTEGTTQLIWESTSPVVFSLPLKFNAVRDANLEVSQPILRLLSLVVPSNDNTILHAPGPSLGSSYSVHIAIGNMFIFQDVIVQSVQAQFSTLASDSGDFVYADVNVSVTTSRILTKASLAKAFKSRGTFNTGV